MASSEQASELVASDKLSKYLKAQVAHLKDERDFFISQNQQLKESPEYTEILLNSLRRMEKRVSTLIDENFYLCKQASDATCERDRIAFAFDQATEVFNNARQTADEFQKMYVQNEAKIAKCDARVQRIIDDAELEAAKDRKIISAYADRIAQHEEYKAEMTRKLKEYKAEMKLKLKEAEDDKNDYVAKYNAAETKAAKRDVMIAKLVAEKKALEVRLQETGAALEKLRTSSKEAVDSTTASLAKSEARRAELIAKNNRLKTKFNVIREQAARSSITEEKKKLQEEREAFERKVKQLEAIKASMAMLIHDARVGRDEAEESKKREAEEPSAEQSPEKKRRVETEAEEVEKFSDDEDKDDFTDDDIRFAGDSRQQEEEEEEEEEEKQAAYLVEVEPPRHVHTSLKLSEPDFSQPAVRNQERNKSPELERFVSRHESTIATVDHAHNQQEGDSMDKQVSDLAKNFVMQKRLITVDTASGIVSSIDELSKAIDLSACTKATQESFIDSLVAVRSALSSAVRRKDPDAFNRYDSIIDGITKTLSPNK